MLITTLIDRCTYRSATSARVFAEAAVVTSTKLDVCGKRRNPMNGHHYFNRPLHVSQRETSARMFAEAAVVNHGRRPD
jgi:hypothetical protein